MQSRSTERKMVPQRKTRKAHTFAHPYSDRQTTKGVRAHRPSTHTRERERVTTPVHIHTLTYTHTHTQPDYTCANPSSWRYCVSCVVFPDPVYAHKSTWALLPSRTRSATCFRVRVELNDLAWQRHECVSFSSHGFTSNIFGQGCLLATVLVSRSCPHKETQKRCIMPSRAKAK